MGHVPLQHLMTRRSVVANNLCEPGPDADQLTEMLTAAARVPDHKVLEPWRFIRFTGEARAEFGKIIAEVCARREPDAGARRLEMEAGRFLRAPVVIAVISSPTQNPVVPEWEQVLSAGAVCQNLLHAAHALGFSAQWITEWYAYDDEIMRALGLEPVERVAGWVYIGSAKDTPKERARPKVHDIVSDWRAS